jgi:hypothetical protein
MGPTGKIEGRLRYLPGPMPPVDQPPLQYEDLTLELTGLGADGAFAVRALGDTPAGLEMRADQAERPVFKAEDFRLLVGKLERRQADEEQLLRLGETLAGLALPGRIREIFERSLDEVRKRGHGLRLRLRVEPLELAALPWEYLLVKRAAGGATPDDFLCLRPDVSVVRHEVIDAPPPPLPARQRYKVAVALANPVSLDGSLPSLEVEADEQAIRAAVEALNARAQDSVELVVRNDATRAGLLEAVTGADIFHFGGHGVFEGAGLGPDGSVLRKGKLVLADDQGAEDRIPSDELAPLLVGAGIRLVVLGACNGASRDAGGPWSGVAPALVRGNIPAVVGMQFKVADTAASRFIEALYAGVLAGLTIDESVSAGRRALFAQANAQNSWAKRRDWGGPVLYLRARTGVLFPLQDTAEGSGGAGVRIRSNLKIDRLFGKATGVEVDEAREGEVHSAVTIGTAEAGSETIGTKIKIIGSRRD